MSRLCNKFWITVTLVLSLIFAILAYPSFHRSHGFFPALLFTLIGVVVIWIVYLIRAYLFSSFEKEREKE